MDDPSFTFLMVVVYVFTAPAIAVMWVLKKLHIVSEDW